jgi:hypothetical protein
MNYLDKIANNDKVSLNIERKVSNESTDTDEREIVHRLSRISNRILNNDTEIKSLSRKNSDLKFQLNSSSKRNINNIENNSNRIVTSIINQIIDKICQNMVIKEEWNEGSIHEDSFNIAKTNKVIPVIYLYLNYFRVVEQIHLFLKNYLE